MLQLVPHLFGERVGSPALTLVLARRHALLQAEVLLLEHLVLLRECLEPPVQRPDGGLELIALGVNLRELTPKVRGGGGDVAGLFLPRR